MARGGAHIAATVLLAGLLALAACAPQPTVQARWPRADRERVVPAAPTRPRWPLTGLLAGSAEAVPPPVLVPFGPGTLPAGADTADFVWEFPAPSGTSRLDMAFQSQVPAGYVGPVAGASDAEAGLAAAHAALLAYAGRRPTALASGPADAGQTLRPDAYRREKGGYTVDVARLTADSTAAVPVPALTFAEVAPVAGGTPVSVMTVPYGPRDRVEWRYDRSSASYVRAVGGRPVSAAGRPVHAVNVVVAWTVPIPRSAGVALSGRGRASLFRGGRKYSGSWDTSGTGTVVLRTEGGEVLPLAPGNTWMEVVPNALDIVVR